MAKKSAIRYVPLVFLAMLGICLLTSSASAYYFTKGGPEDLQVNFEEYSIFSGYPEDAKLVYDYDMAYQAAVEAQEYAWENGIDLDGRSLENMRDEIMFHARAYYFPLDIPFNQRDDGTWRTSHEAANPADIGNTDEYWTPVGPDVVKIMKEKIELMGNDQ